MNDLTLMHRAGTIGISRGFDKMKFILEAKVETILDAEDCEEAMDIFIKDLFEQGLIVNELNAEYASTIH